MDRVEKPDAARDNVEERDDAFNWSVCWRKCAREGLRTFGQVILAAMCCSDSTSFLSCFLRFVFVFPLGKRSVVLGYQGRCDGTQ